MAIWGNLLLVKNISNPPYYRRFLAEELARRVELNPRYSLRGYAQFLGVGPGALSEILNGQRSPSAKLVERMFTVFELGEHDRSKLLSSLLDEKKQLGRARISKTLKDKVYADQKTLEPIPDYQELGKDRFRVIADWYHLAIWEMVERKDFVASPNWIAKRLGISSTETKLAFQRLSSEKLIELKDGRWKKTANRIQTKDMSKTSDAHRKRQVQILEKAKTALELIPLPLRHHSAITINIDPSRIPEMREKIQKALWSIAAELSSGDARQVYEVALQVFPLENPQTKEGK